MARGYTFLDLAEEVLGKAKIPLACKEIWEKALEFGLVSKLGSVGKTPWQTLYAILYVGVKNEHFPLMIVSKKPTKFWLKSRQEELDSKELQKSIQLQIQKEEKANQKNYCERDLHPLLVKFLKESEEFNLCCKTIYHEESKKQKSGKNRWIHPDIVGVHFPFGFQEQTTELLKNFAQTPYELYSFELKIRIDFSNLRECYFQAVSNSSWANEGYLVVLECDESQEFMDELWRLNNAFGIGVIKLNADNLLDSEVLIPSDEREQLDFKTIDLLVGENPNFRNFIESINRNIKVSDSNYLIEKDFDRVFEDLEMKTYIKDKKIG
ncbi:HTH domain-containing protein [Helicobacter kayseriensis]|uniref:HTH domain-containing protein n=1 Tax=Helicobacter kayseriensis TaxID=2905877 RepID=UPI001E5C53AF|nr:HTH domain-containing protein [Helicobacter kayseriensis]MCE3047341.1 HrgA protein [Helicobacter kayseriensis]MCE3048712.1 HrgA protein [Helicobacter kayseriensis]